MSAGMEAARRVRLGRSWWMSKRQVLRVALIAVVAMQAVTVNATTQFSINPGAIEQPTGSGGDADHAVVRAEGVVLATGNRLDSELDFAAEGEMGLYLLRTHNNYWSATGIFGGRWLSSFDYSLTFSTANGQSIGWAQRPDGRRVKYIAANGRWNEDKSAAVSYIVRNADGSYTLYGEDRGTETYDASGYITQKANATGVTWTFAYTGKLLQRVTHSSGRSVQFTWANGAVTQVVDPAGNVFSYTYTANAFGTGRPRLATATQPGAPAMKIIYHYEDSRFPGALTGKTRNSVRYSTIAYDDKNRVISSQRAGGVEKYTFAYTVESETPVNDAPLPPPPGGYLPEERDRPICSRGICTVPRSVGGGIAIPMTTASAGTASVGAMSMAAAASGATVPRKMTVVETNPLGRVTTYVFTDSKLDSVESGTQYGIRTYDSNGYLDLVHDFEDGITDYDYDAHGHLLKVTQAKGTSAQRVTEYEWDEGRNLLTRKLQPGQLDTRYTYNDRGRIESVVETNLSSTGLSGQQRRTSYTYTYQTNGLLSKEVVDGPVSGSTDAVTTTYSADGFVANMRNGAGHVATFSGYNGLGLPAKLVGLNGDTTAFTYDAAGRLLKTTITLIDGTTRDTVRTYDSAGLLSTVRTPDNVTRTYRYDSARRLQREFQPEPGGTVALTRYTYNAASQVRTIANERTTVPSAGTPVLSAPTDSTTGAFAVSWSKVADAVTYALEESANGGTFTQVQNSSAVSRSVSGKAAGSYRYRVRACSEAGCGAYSNVGTVTVIVAPAAAPAVNAPAVNGEGSYSVSWTSAGGATRYRLEESANGGGWNAVHDGAGNSIALTGRDVNAVHAYRAQACNAAGCGPWSAAAQVQRVVYGAQFVSQSVPLWMAAGQTYAVTVQLRNTGNAEWKSSAHYRLGSQNPGDNLSWGMHRVDTPGAVAPGAVASFTFTVTAPATAGTWNFQWRMVRDGYAWFGDTTPNLRPTTMTGTLSANPNPCSIYLGEGVCTSRLSWSTTAGDAQVWASSPDGSGMALFAQARSGNQSANWITPDGALFHLISNGQTLQKLLVRGNQLNQHRPEPPETCSTPRCVPR